MSNEYFTGNPIKLDISRSKYHLSPRWTGSWNIGTLVPIFATSLIMPGDTARMAISSAIRTTTPITAIMDDMDMQVECWFVPHHLILSRQYMSPSVGDSNRSWAAFIGAQDSLLNMPLPADVALPYFTVHHAGIIGGLADCLGYPRVSTGYNYHVNPLKVLAYSAIWNEAYRDPNTMSPVTFGIGSGDACQLTVPEQSLSGVTSLDSINLYPTCRYHGYFGSALPWPQRNTDTVKLPLGTSAPVLVGGTPNVSSGSLSVHFSGPVTTGSPVFYALGGTANTGSTSTVTQIMNGPTNLADQDVRVDGLNLYTDLSTATAASVNAFRFAVQLQRWYEQLARSGNREGEITYGMFGVRGNDEGLKRPEYLGGKRIPIIQSQVPSTGNLTTTSSGQVSLGSVGAFSLTNDSDYYFTKSFTTWGTLMVVMTCRTRESFSNGISREDTKFERFDYYWPQFANLGEQPVYNQEIFVSGVASADKGVFGYQEAWAEYRMIPDMVTGLIRPSVSGGLGYMTYANNFASAPTLKGYLNAEGQQTNVDRTLQVASGTSGLTFYGQFQFDLDLVRPMPLYSIPGLVDHH